MQSRFIDSREFLKRLNPFQRAVVPPFACITVNVGQEIRFIVHTYLHICEHDTLSKTNKFDAFLLPDHPLGFFKDQNTPHNMGPVSDSRPKREVDANCIRLPRTIGAQMTDAEHFASVAVVFVSGRHRAPISHLSGQPTSR